MVGKAILTLFLRFLSSLYVGFFCFFVFFCFIFGVGVVVAAVVTLTVEK